MEFAIYYASGKKFDKDDFDFFEKNHIKYDKDRSTYVINSIMLPDFDWSKIECLYDHFKAIIIGQMNVIIYDDYIE